MIIIRIKKEDNAVNIRNLNISHANEKNEITSTNNDSDQRAILALVQILSANENNNPDQ